MSVVEFRPSRPTTQSVIAQVMRASVQARGWSLEVDEADDGQPYVTAEHVSGGTLSAHWGRDGWAILTEALEIVAQSPSLDAALARVL